MRKRPNLAPRMEKCLGLMNENPEELRGKWMDTYPGHERLYLELGCGKGRFTVNTAKDIPETLYPAGFREYPRRYYRQRREEAVDRLRRLL